LDDLRDAVNSLSGSSVLGAVRYADFLQQLREGVRVPGVLPPTLPGGKNYYPPTPSPDEIVTGKIEELQLLITQALQDVQGIYRDISVNEALVTGIYGLAQENLGEVEDHADELADQADELAEHALELLDLATTLNAIELDFYDPVSGLLAVSTLLDGTVVRVDANEDSIDVLTAQVTSLESELIDTTALDPGIMWQFEADDDDFTSNVTLTPNSFYLRQAAGASGYLRSPSGIAIDGRLFTRIVARIRRNSGTGWLGRASYAVVSGHGIDTTNYHLTIVTEPSLAGGGWAIVSWNMELLTAGGTDWTDSIIDQIQLELSDDGSTVFDVDWIAIGRVAPSYVTSTVNALEARVTATEDSITTLSAVITSLDTRVDDVEGDVDAQATAIDTLDTRITVAEGDISANSTAITSLELSLEDAEDDIAANVSAISGLDTRLDSAEGTISLHASDLTSLDARLDAAEGDIDGAASAITSLDARVDATESSITTHASRLTALEVTVDDPVNGLDALSTLVNTFDTRITAAEDSVDAFAFTLTALESQVEDLDDDVGGFASAITTLNTRVSTVESSVTSQASQLTLLQARGGGVSANLVNPLDVAAYATGWDTITNSDVFSINVGARNAVAARLRTSANMQITSADIIVEPHEILEVRVSVLKRQAHGYMYIGGSAYTTPGGAVEACTRIYQQAVYDTVENAYFMFAGANQTANTIPVDAWFDFVFYLLGSNVPLNQCPPGKVGNSLNRSGGINITHPWIPFQVDGMRLLGGSRYFRMRILNYYNAIQTDMHVNHVSVKKIDNQVTAAVESEQTARVSGDQANATAITTVSTTVAGNTASINTLTSSVNGISAQWVMQLDINGRITGLRLAGSPASTSFAILADAFSVVIPGVGQVVPFTVGTLNGVPTVGINGQLIVDGTIFARHIVAQQITTPALSNNAATRATAVIGVGGAPAGTGNQPLLNMVMNDVTANSAGIVSYVQLTFYLDLIHNTNVNPTGCGVRITRAPVGGSEVEIFRDTVDSIEVDNWLGSLIRPQAYTIFDRPPAVGPWEYRFYAIIPPASGSWQYGIHGLGGIEFRR
jgi:predicted  nucleic acid-binding Zn-ribbon protein